MKFSLAEMLGRRAPTIDIVDVGAMIMDGVPNEYRQLIATGIARIIGFEPVKAECDKLNAQAGKNQRFVPYFVGDGGERTFHLCNESMTSSLFEPNTALLKRFNNLEELVRCVERSPVQTTRLDDIPEITGCDFLKLDIQGAELDALKGATRTLESTLVVQVEVEFVPLYKEQPLFGDVDRALRERGFVFHTFAGLMGRAFKPLIINNNPNLRVKQLLWGDAVYVKDFMRFAELPAEQLLKLAVILHEVYESIDLAALALQHYDAKTKTGLWPIYVKRFNDGGKAPVPPPLD